MKIAFVSSEVVPFSKTGGLADVSGALPKFLSSLGNDVVVFTPLYRDIREKFRPKKIGRPISVPVGPDLVTGQIWTTTFPESKVPVYFIACDPYFNREGLYGDAKADYSDNCSRFVFFSRAVLAALKELDFKPDVIHANDWQAGLIPMYLKIGNAAGNSNSNSRPPVVYTVHNLAYQGLFWHWDIPLLNVGWEHFNYKELEFFGKINFMKGGIAFADTVTTVSPTYAREIQSDEELGAGLQGVLKERSKDLVGILNGVDYADWNPETDALIPARYSLADRVGKAECKQALQREAGFLQKPRVPVIGMITRLVDQKGFDLIAAVVGDMMKEDLQLVILGTGLEKYHTLLTGIARNYPKKCAIFLKFDNRLAHLIEAGSDMFLMPSRYEPCGLNQMYSLKYGTVPIVRATGGLADTVTDATDANVKAGSANGFSFVPYEAAALIQSVRGALSAYADAQLWERIAQTGMKQDWSWTRSAREYERVYRETIEKKKKRV